MFKTLIYVVLVLLAWNDYEAVTDTDLPTVNRYHLVVNADHSEGVEFLKKVEGWSATPFWDHKFYSIGYGFSIKRYPELKGITHMTKEHGHKLLVEEYQNTLRFIQRQVKVHLTKHQQIALVSFVFNVGESAFLSSTLLDKLNKGLYNEASHEFKRWVYAGGKLNAGLQNRRMQETELFNTRYN